eukprot:5450518-Lingulodinium_polyedra.AAC.1
MSQAKWPGAFARGCPVKSVRHRRAEPGNTRLSKDYGRRATKLLKYIYIYTPVYMLWNTL